MLLKMENGRATTLPHWIQLTGPWAVHRCLCPIILIPPTPQGSVDDVGLGHLQLLVGFKVQTHFVRKSHTHQWF